MSVINFENKPVLINHNCPNFYCKGDNNNEKTSNMFCSYCPLDIELSRGVITFEGMLLIAGAANVLTTLRKNSEPKCSTSYFCYYYFYSLTTLKKTLFFSCSHRLSRTPRLPLHIRIFSRR
jgi:hypothetical protein